MGPWIFPREGKRALTSLRGLAHSTSAGSGTSPWQEGIHLQSVAGKKRKVKDMLKKSRFRASTLRFAARMGLGVRKPVSRVSIKRKVKWPKFRFRKRVRRAVSNKRNAPKRTRLLQTHDDMARSKLSKGLITVSRTADQMTIFRHRKTPAFDGALRDIRSRMRQLLEPAQIVDARQNYDGTAITCDSGKQQITQMGSFTKQNIEDYRLAVAAMSNPLLINGGRGPFPTQSGGILQSTGANITLTDSMAKVMFPVWKQRYVFRNTGNMRAHLEVYDYVCKADTNVTAVEAWDDVFTTTNELATTEQLAELNTDLTDYTTTAAPDKETIGYRPMGKGLNKYWGLVASFKYDVEPGRSAAYEFKCFQKSFSKWDFDNCPTAFVKGWTRQVIVIIRGSLIGATANSGTGDDAISYSDARFTRSIEEKVLMYGYRNYQPQRSLAYRLEAGATAATANYYAIVPDTNQVQINPETDSGTSGFVGAYT